MGMEQRLTIRQEATPSQKQEAKQLLRCLQELREPYFPEAVRGAEGIRVADQILKKKGLTGILVGGLVKDLWNPRVSVAKLKEHKDVDVIVTGGHERIARFEGGVDWWSSEVRKMSVTGRDSSNYDLDVRFHRNGNGIILHYRLRNFTELESGLYVPSYELERNVQYGQLDGLADFTSTTGEVNGLVLDEAFEKLVLKQERQDIPKEVRASVVGECGSYQVEVETVPASEYKSAKLNYFGKSAFR